MCLNHDGIISKTFESHTAHDNQVHREIEDFLSTCGSNDMTATCAGLPEGFATKDVDNEDDDLGEIREGVNDFKGHGYHGPNPPSGEHTFEFHLYALDAKLKLPKKVSDELGHKT